MSEIKFGCQVYTWYMSYDKYNGEVRHTLDVIANSKFTGIEPMTDFMGDYFEDYALMQDALQQTKVALPAIAFSQPWLGAEETADEQQEADKAIAYLKHFPGTILMLYHTPVGNRDDLLEKQKHQTGIINTIAERAAAEGIKSAFHANSPSNALFNTQEDYYRLADLLDDRFVGLALDAGHMAHGKCDVLKLFKEFMPKVWHVHYKDMLADGSWALMGKGVIDFVAITKLLRDNDYDGWIMVEDESPEGEKDPDSATMENGVYIADFLMG
ncbi:MAG: sugar phosphate isomerase/epimerase [Clostridiales Family XIII bacterium]|jgi:inosose dehydratase|nr:sugar phosphate isomerase/epimerase [Clostridiales Family XIII bacterium]